MQPNNRWRGSAQDKVEQNEVGQIVSFESLFTNDRDHVLSEALRTGDLTVIFESVWLVGWIEVEVPVEALEAHKRKLERKKPGRKPEVITLVVPGTIVASDSVSQEPQLAYTN